MKLRGPDNTKRTIILGRTGTGKSQFGLHLLAAQNWDRQPWVILDYKGEDLVTDIWRANQRTVPRINVEDDPPKKPGLYIMELRPKLDDAALGVWLFKVYARGRVGLFIDEGFAMPDKGMGADALDIIFTQGRTKKIPVIALYQRPVYMTRFAVAQSDFFSVFAQNDERDLKTTAQFISPAKLKTGQSVTVYDTLPKYHSLWYDVGQGSSCVLGPAPARDAILNRYNERIDALKRRALI